MSSLFGCGLQLCTVGYLLLLGHEPRPSLHDCMTSLCNVGAESQSETDPWTETDPSAASHTMYTDTVRLMQLREGGISNDPQEGRTYITSLDLVS